MNEQEISWGSLGADPVNRLVLDGTFMGHTAHADIVFAGDFSGDGNIEMLDYLGWNPFKAVSRAVKKVGRGAKNLVTNPVKFASRGAQNVAHTATTAGRTIAYAAKKAAPYVKYGAIGVSVAFPPAAPLAAGIAVATTAVAAADGKIPKVKGAARNVAIARKQKAQKLIVNTAKLAKKGDKEAKRAMSTIKSVRKARINAAKKGFRRAWTVTTKGYLQRVL